MKENRLKQGDFNHKTRGTGVLERAALIRCGLPDSLTG